MLIAQATLLFLTVSYATILGAMAWGVRRVLRQPVLSLTHPLQVSVIVPARDEAAVIRAGLDRLIACDYPASCYEIIVVDDLSEDATPDIVRAYAERRTPNQPRIRLVQMPENLDRTRAHKKRAIEKAISLATGEVILTTDADCLVPPTWIQQMAAPFTHGYAFVSGPVLLTPGDTLFLRMQALEFLGLVAFGAGGIGIGRPNMANGANVAYRKDVFERLGGFSGLDHLTSGDDELLMQKMADETEERIYFIAQPDAAVVTEPVRSWRAFFEQRRRWGSKGAHYPSLLLRVLVLAVYFFHLALLGAPLLLWGWPGLWAAFLLAFAAKISVEAMVLAPFARRFRRAWLLRYFLLAQLLHVPYIVGIGLAAFAGGYTWKGRHVAR